MADRVVFQVDQAAPANQVLLWHPPKHRENPNLDRRLGVLASGHRQKALGSQLSLYTILQILSVSIFEKTPLIELFSQSNYQNLQPPSPNQLLLFDNVGTLLFDILGSERQEEF